MHWGRHLEDCPLNWAMDMDVSVHLQWMQTHGCGCKYGNGNTEYWLKSDPALSTCIKGRSMPWISCVISNTQPEPRSVYISVSWVKLMTERASGDCSAMEKLIFVAEPCQMGMAFLHMPQITDDQNL